MHVERLEATAGLKGDVVRVTLPARAAFEIDSMGKVLANLAERLGHTGCLSGSNCFFTLEKEFVVDPELNVHSFGEVIGH